ncbi:hypothetical protein [Nannocystis radixulma]|uniref:Uncharacterized protein n=1 Tax=Nannocystis radixulma TaxID=2995305 RepID=A0ABT5BGB1_9BACT|nr:hypothetical protein [Nannocystis radixulma]MDC0673164.1 hypothetical protein [Nannocystis radixulma]
MAQRRSTTTEIEPGVGWQLVVSGALVFVGCDPPASWQAHPYAPASVGDEWVYSIPQAHPGVKEPTTQSIDRILAAEQRGDRLVARVRSEFFGGNSERDLVITAIGVTPEIGTMTSSVGEVTARAAEGVYLPRELSLGMRWDWRQELDTPVSAMAVAGRCAVVGHDWFRGQTAVHVRCETHNRMTTTAKIGAAVPPIEHVQTEDNFYVRGLGLVRSVTTTPQGYRSEKLLVRWQVAGAPLVAVDTPAIAVGEP